jgi:hypothetical protein
MNKLILLGVLVTPVLGACGASIPPPTQRLADAQAAERSARELGANNDPAAQLSLRLAQEQIAQAQRALEEDDNERADSLALRAKADAELALARARERAARVEAQKAISESAAAQKDLNQGGSK